MARHEYADGTSLVHRDGSFAGELIGGSAMCVDGKVRNIHPTNDGVADTFFSIPAFVYEKGKRVYGFVSVNTRLGFSTASSDDPAVVYFTAHQYRKHHALIVCPHPEDKRDRRYVSGVGIAPYCRQCLSALPETDTDKGWS